MKTQLNTAKQELRATAHRDLPEVISPLRICKQVQSILGNETNLPLANLEQADRYYHDRLARPDIVMEVAEAAIVRAQVGELCDNRVRLGVIRAAREELEAIFDPNDVALNHELAREQPVKPTGGAVSGATFASA